MLVAIREFDEYPKRRLILKCDHCGNEFEHARVRKRVMDQVYHFCSVLCKSQEQKSGGKLYSTRISDSDVRERIEESMLERYGHRTNVERPCVRERVKELAHTDEAWQKRRESFRSRTGYDHVFQTPDFLAGAKERARRAWETKKKNGTYKTSREEDSFYEALKLAFGDENVDRQVVLANWHIDFHIKSLDVYVQYDGAYWHGLGRGLSEVANSSAAHDTGIYTNMVNDLKQGIYCQSNSIALYRVNSRRLPGELEAVLEEIRGMV
jgi:hypothetical protein